MYEHIKLLVNSIHRYGLQVVFMKDTTRKPFQITMVAKAVLALEPVLSWRIDLLIWL